MSHIILHCFSFSLTGTYMKRQEIAKEVSVNCKSLYLLCHENACYMVALSIKINLKVNKLVFKTKLLNIKRSRD